MDDLKQAFRISNAGMKAQAQRLRVVSENLANADSLPTGPNDTPYRRKIVTFKNELDRKMGVTTLKVDKVLEDKADFVPKLDPGHPAADEDGFVLAPNVNPIIEMMDMQEAQRSYEANLTVLDNTRNMLRQTIGILAN